MVVLLHTNTVILLELSGGTIMLRDKHEIQTEVGTKELSSQVKSVSVYDIFTCCHTEAEAQ